MKTLISTGEVARLLRVSVDTVRAWSDVGRLHAERSAAGRRLIPVAEVEQLARARARRFKIGGRP